MRSSPISRRPVYSRRAPARAASRDARSAAAREEGPAKPDPTMCVRTGQPGPHLREEPADFGIRGVMIQDPPDLRTVPALGRIGGNLVEQQVGALGVLDEILGIARIPGDHDGSRAVLNPVSVGRLDVLTVVNQEGRHGHPTLVEQTDSPAKSVAAMAIPSRDSRWSARRMATSA